MKAAYLSMLPDSEARPFGEDEVELFRSAKMTFFHSLAQPHVPLLLFVVVDNCACTVKHLKHASVCKIHL